MVCIGWSALGSVAVLVALELLARALPVSTSTATGYYFDSLILSYPAHHRFTTASGWNLQNARHHNSNNVGFLSEHEFIADNHAIALIGDSYVEANMLRPVDRLDSQLEELVARPVYALGSPGTAMLDYAERVRFASDHFGIRDFVILMERGDIGESICGSGNVAAACLDSKTLIARVERQSAPSLLKRILRESALAQYLFSQLKLNPVGSISAWLALLQPSHPAPGNQTTLLDYANPPDAVTQRVLEQFFDKIKPYRTEKLILVLAPGWQPAPLAALQAAARANHVVVLDAAPLADSMLTNSGLSPFVSPSDKHLNKLALGEIANQVAPLLR